jgi:nicotinamidase-related amidase
MPSLYLVIDLINDLLGHDPMRNEVERRNVLANTVQAIAKARAASVPVAYVRVGFTGDFTEAPAASPLFGSFKGSGMLKLGTPGTQVHAAVAPLDSDIDIIKHAVSPFIGTILDAEITRLGIDRLYVSGISTALAISSAVREGHDRGLAMTLIEDGCAADSEGEHGAEIAILGRLCTVTSAADVRF